MSESKDVDLSKHVIIRRHDNSVYAIPVDRLDEFKLDDKAVQALKAKATQDALGDQQEAFKSDLVNKPGCYRG